jgi:hypothetical protein
LRFQCQHHCKPERLLLAVRQQPRLTRQHSGEIGCLGN